MSKMIKKKKKNRGFTLIEILVAVLILSLLVAIAVPSYMRAVERSRTSDPINTLKSIAKAEQVQKLRVGEYTNQTQNLDLELRDYPAGNTVAGDTFEGQYYTYKVYGEDEAAATAGRKTTDEADFYELSVDYGTGEIFCRPATHKICMDLGLDEGQPHGKPVYDTRNIQNWNMKNWVEYVRDELADLWETDCWGNDFACIQEKAFSLCADDGEGVCLSAKRTKQIVGADGFTYYWDNNAAYPVLRINDYASRPFFAEIFFTPGGGVYLRGNYGHNGTVVDDLCEELNLRSHTPEFSPGWATCSLK